MRPDTPPAVVVAPLVIVAGLVLAPLALVVIPHLSWVLLVWLAVLGLI